MKNKTANDNIERLKCQSYEAIKHLKTAHYLIAKYIPNYWKKDRTDINYILKEMDIISYLKMIKNMPDSLFVEGLAENLEVGSLALYNDPNLIIDLHYGDEPLCISKTVHHGIILKEMHQKATSRTD